ncbi:response regulator [Sorangium sp. So ce1504]|uniref:response regulator n=1 Tax=Sorangium sp. So ce1504 TaxID=3133337 RepID=UPI003F61FCF9
MHNRSARQGLERPPLIDTRDLEAARVLLATIYGDLTADTVGRGHRFEWRATPVDMGPVSLFSGAFASGMCLRGVSSGYTVSMATGGSVPAASSGEAAEIAPGRSAAVFSPGVRSEWSVEGPARPMNLRVDARYLEAQLEALTGVAIRGPLAFSLSMPTTDGPGTFLARLCRFLSTETERAGRALGHPVVMASLGEAVARALLFGQPHDHAHLLEKAAPPSSRSVVRLVEEYLDAHAEGPIGTADLTTLAGASMASIDGAFAYRGATPWDFLRKRRLLLARDRLLLAEPGETAASVAHAAGYLRVERFGAAYAAEFGETPAETRRRGLLAAEAPPSPRPRATSPSPRGAEAATVFLVHRDPCWRGAAAGLLQEAGHVVQAFASSLALLEAARAVVSGCVVLDVQLPDLNGLEVRALLREEGCALPVVFTSDDGDVTVAVEAMKAGAVDFLAEPLDAEALLAAVARALALDAEARAARAEVEALAARLAALSPRQREVCERVARGMLNKQIATELGISMSAVRLYRSEGMEKLGVASAAELASLFARHERGTGEGGG